MLDVIITNILLRKTFKGWKTELLGVPVA